MPNRAVARPSKAPARRRRSLSSRARDEWGAELEALRTLLQGRPKGSHPSISPFDNRSGRLRRFVYAMVRRLRKQKRLGLIGEVVRALEHEPTKVTLRQNPFYWAFYALERDEGFDITDKDMSRYAAQLLYADRHDVDEVFLIGFIFQQGSHASLQAKLRGNERETWFAEYKARLDSDW